MVKKQLKSVTYKVRNKCHHKDYRRQLAQQAIKTTIEKNNIIVSGAITVKDICATSNYNRSVEIAHCGSGKLLIPK